MKIDVLFVSEEAERIPLTDQCVLVIDVLRATTTIVAALAAGAPVVHPVADVEEARRLAQELPRAILGGERGGLPLPGFHAGNSPAEYTTDLVTERPVVITTTNGTLAMRRALAAGAEAMGAAALLNAQAAAEWALEQGRDLTIVCAGTEGRFTLEDTIGAGCVIERSLAYEPRLDLTDAARAALRLWQEYRSDPGRAFSDSFHGRRLERLGFAEDLHACARVDGERVVPVWHDGRLIPYLCDGSGNRS